MHHPFLDTGPTIGFCGSFPLWPRQYACPFGSVLSQVTFFGKKGISWCDTSRGLNNCCVIGFACSLLSFDHETMSGSTFWRICVTHAFPTRTDQSTASPPSSVKWAQPRSTEPPGWPFRHMERKTFYWRPQRCCGWSLNNDTLMISSWHYEL